jgi:hypothetical protein
MLPFIILGALGMIAYGVSEENKTKTSGRKSYSKGLPTKIKWDKKNNIYSKSVGGKFVKISKSEFDSLYNDAHEGYYYQANAQHKGGIMTYTLRSIHSKTKMGKGGDLETKYQIVIDNDWENPMFFDTIASAKKFALKNTKKSDIEIIDFSGDSIFIEKDSSKEDFDWLFSNQMAKGGRIGQSGYAIMEDGKLRTDAWRRVEFFATIEKALFKLSHIPFYKPLSKEEKLKLIVPYTIPKMAKGGNISSEISALYEKSGFINDDYNWKSKLLEMLQDSSVEAYQIYQKLTAKEKKDVLQELFEMENDMGADGDEDIETSKENLSMFLSDSKNGKKYGDGGVIKGKIWGINVFFDELSPNSIKQNKLKDWLDENFFQWSLGVNFKNSKKVGYKIQIMTKGLDLSEYEKIISFLNKSKFNFVEDKK